MSSPTIENPRLTIAQSTELFRIKRTVKQSTEVVASELQRSRTHAQAALAEALIGGAELLKARRILGKTAFDAWLVESFQHQPDVVRVCVTLAWAQSNDESLTTKTGVTEAFKALGILE